MQQHGRVWERILDLLFPRQCLACAVALTAGDETFICKACWQSMDVIVSPYCPCCGLPFVSKEALRESPEHRCGSCRIVPPPFHAARAVGQYKGVLREAIHAFKYRKKLRVGKSLVVLMAQYWTDRFPEQTFDYLIPIPLHPRRLRDREFNQAQVLAEGLGRLRHIPVLSSVLVKSRWTRSQVELSGKERRENVKGTFLLKDPARIQDKSILLIDDVFTTGATVTEAAKILYAGGASQVAVYTLARVIDG